MSLDVSRLRAVTTDYTVDLDSRCRSIARNALQASREAHGRGTALYTDDEAKRERMIEKILRLDLTKYEGNTEDNLLVSETQTSDPLVNTVSDILERGLEAALADRATSDANTSPRAPKATPTKA
jgi:hypothetical protein